MSRGQVSRNADPDPQASRNGTFIAAAIDGQQAGERFVRRLDSTTDADALYRTIVEAYASNDSAQATLRGLCRAIQKHLERQLA